MGVGEMKTKIDLRNPATIEQAIIELNDAYRQAYAYERVALARCLAVKLRDFEEKVRREKSTAAAVRHADIIKSVLGN
jgi:hypothetical protein